MNSTAPAKPRFTLRLKLSVGLILIIVALFAGLNTYSIANHRKARLNDAITSSQTIARLIAGALVVELAEHGLESKRVDGVLRNYLTSLSEMMKRDPTLAYVVVTNKDDQLVRGLARTKLITFTDNAPTGTEAEALAAIVGGSRALGPAMRATSFKLQRPSGGSVGKLVVGISLADMERQARREVIVSASVLVVAIVALILYASFALGRMVVTPLGRVVAAMRAVREGDLSQDVDVQRSDEIGVLANSFNFMLQGLREREKLKDAFSRYVSRQVYDKLQAGEITLSGEVREATILFSDIRSFTALSEQMRADEVVQMLNEYFTEMVEIIFRYDGFLNKFIGDAIMAVYNVPLSQESPALRAVRTAIDMRDALERLNQRRVQRGDFPLKIGIGINTGPVVAGNIGHEQRLEYTVIGDAVNLAQRIESQTKVSGTTILISDTTYNHVRRHINATALPPVKVKGKQEPVTLWTVDGLATPGQSPETPKT